jgi:hypothetical protein
LHAVISGDGTGTLDTEDREVVIPDLTAPELGISTPRVHVARNAREYQQLVGDPTVVPTATREFRRTDRLVVRFEALAPGGVGPTITARLLNRQGQKMVDVPVTMPATPGDPCMVDLPLASLPPGEYVLEVAASVDGQTPATELIAFKVGS